jgi:large subunit ribosomal protein L29
MKGAPVHDMADGQLLDHIRAARREVFNLRFQHATGQLENTARLGQAKRDLARGLTVASERGMDVDRELRSKGDG